MLRNVGQSRLWDGAAREDRRMDAPLRSVEDDPAQVRAVSRADDVKVDGRLGSGKLDPSIIVLALSSAWARSASRSSIGLAATAPRVRWRGGTSRPPPDGAPMSAPESDRPTPTDTRARLRRPGDALPDASIGDGPDPVASRRPRLHRRRAARSDHRPSSTRSPGSGTRARNSTTACRRAPSCARSWRGATSGWRRSTQPCRPARPASGRTRSRSGANGCGCWSRRWRHPVRRARWIAGSRRASGSCRHRRHTTAVRCSLGGADRGPPHARRRDQRGRAAPRVSTAHTPADDTSNTLAEVEGLVTTTDPGQVGIRRCRA